MEEVEKKYNGYDDFYKSEIQKKLPLHLIKFRRLSVEEKIDAYYKDVVELHKSRSHSERKESSSGLTSVQNHALCLKKVSEEIKLFTDTETNLYLEKVIKEADRVLFEKMGARAVDNSLLFSTILNCMPPVNTEEGVELLKVFQAKQKEIGNEVYKK